VALVCVLEPKEKLGFAAVAGCAPNGVLDGAADPKLNDDCDGAPVRT
jgi:hypothetical protein